MITSGSCPHPHLPHHGVSPRRLAEANDYAEALLRTRLSIASWQHQTGDITVAANEVVWPHGNATGRDEHVTLKPRLQSGSMRSLVVRDGRTRSAAAVSP